MVGEVVQPGRGMKSVPWFCGILSAKPKEHLLLGGFKYFLSSPLPGEMIQFDEHISQMGWNHQPDWIYPSPPTDSSQQDQLLHSESAGNLFKTIAGWGVDQ